MNIIQENNWVITTKRGEGKLPLFCGNIERVTPIYYRHEAAFNDKSILVLNKWSGKDIIKGTRYPRTNLYMLNLTQRNKLMMESTTPDKYFVGSAYKCNTKSTLVDYHHTS